MLLQPGWDLMSVPCWQCDVSCLARDEVLFLPLCPHPSFRFRLSTLSVHPSSSRGPNRGIISVLFGCRLKDRFRAYQFIPIPLTKYYICDRSPPLPSFRSNFAIMPRLSPRPRPTCPLMLRPHSSL